VASLGFVVEAEVCGWSGAGVWGAQTRSPRRSAGFAGRSIYEPSARQIGPFRVTAVPSHDWRGDDQVAWIVESSDRRIIHCGDTIWHGGWYEIARRHPPFDAAFFPINGVIVRLDGFTPTDIPATLTPEQAIEAATILRAGKPCAIHHILFQSPPRYIEQPAAVERFLAAGTRRGINAIAPGEGERIW